jgi:hypothetical protein
VALVAATAIPLAPLFLTSVPFSEAVHDLGEMLLGPLAGG